MTRFLVLLAVVIASGCAKNESQGESSSGTSSAKPADPNAPLPAFAVKPVEPSEAQDIATLKQRTSPQVSKWLSEQTTSDGFIVTYEIPRIEDVQDETTLRFERKQTGVDFGVYLRRNIDGHPHKCVTTRIAKREDIARVVEACKTAKP
ncbi:MAG TPA: hypothetical protein VMZ53_11125 [Kofleriaceae bacterium]|nr:hypothetical protein [Kofleriaceae bacterium]